MIRYSLGIRVLLYRWLAVGLLLLGWGLRLAALEAVPPGWSDDEMVHIYTLSGEVMAGRPTFYFTGASGHEPLYHTLQAGILTLGGINVASAHWLPASSGLLTVALTFALARRLFGRAASLTAGGLLACSFWGLMYSRFAMRQQMVVPLALAALYCLWAAAEGRPPRRKWGVWAGLTLAAALYTYTAARLLPLIFLAFGLYLALFHREWFRRAWRPLLTALLLALALTLPMWRAIAAGRTAEAAAGIGADARLAELAAPLRALQAGDPRPLWENISGTLGMFHATGDPEWLYNISGRPVFNLLGGALLWAGVALSLYRWRTPRYAFLLLWFSFGLLPAFLSVPAASLSHTILAQPAVYILLPIANGEWRAGSSERGAGSSKSAVRYSLLAIRYLLFAICYLLLAARDVRDYFFAWPQEGMVRFLYRAEYRETARYLDDHPEVTDVAVSSALMGPWDRLALETDRRRSRADVRLFHPERALVWCAGQETPRVMLTSWPPLAAPLEEFVGQPWGGQPPMGATARVTPAEFANGLTLTGARLSEDGLLVTAWLVARPLDLPPTPVLPNPPPPGVYAGPRLAVFTHLLAADGTFVAGDDGLWVDPLTLRPGDRFIQIHYLTAPPDAPPGPYTVEIGLYDPLDGARWAVLDEAGRPAADRVLLIASASPLPTHTLPPSQGGN